MCIEDANEYNFDLKEIRDKITDKFNFDIPLAVLSDSLVKMCKKGYLEQYKPPAGDKKFKLIDPSKKPVNYDLNSIDIEGEVSKFNSFTQKILQSIRKKHPEDKKDDIISSFIDTYLYDLKNTKYYSEINDFLLACKNDSKYYELLTEMKEGLVIYEALKENQLDDITSGWDSKLTIFLDTEILFHAGGLNGELFNEIWQEFYDLVRKINQDTKNTIQLKYLPKVEDEINKWFEYLRRVKHNKLGAGNLDFAQKLVYDNSLEASGIAYKQDEFMNTLRGMGIQLDDMDYERDNKYNLTDQQVIASILGYDNNNEKREDYGKREEKLLTGMEVITYINHRRKGKKGLPLSKCRYIMVSGKNDYFKLSKHVFKKDNITHLIHDIFTVTSILWFKTKTNFQESNPLKAFDPIIFSKIAISSMINQKVSLIYEGIQLKIENGDITPEESKQQLYSLRKYSVAPERIDDNYSNEFQYLLYEDDLSEFKALEEAKSKERKKAEKEKENYIKKLETELEQKEQTKDKIKKYTEYVESKSEKRDTIIGKHNSKMRQKQEKYANIILLLINLIVLVLIVFVLYLYSVTENMNWFSVMMTVGVGLVFSVIPHYPKFKRWLKLRIKKLLSKYLLQEIEVDE